MLKKMDAIGFLERIQKIEEKYGSITDFVWEKGFFNKTVKQLDNENHTYQFVDIDELTHYIMLTWGGDWQAPVTGALYIDSNNKWAFYTPKFPINPINDKKLPFGEDNEYDYDFLKKMNFNVDGTDRDIFSWDDVWELKDTEFFKKHFNEYFTAK